jgi:predicted metal-dependent hydrolase
MDYPECRNADSNGIGNAREAVAASARRPSKNQFQFAKPRSHPSNCRVELERIWNPVRRSQGDESLSVGDRRIPMVLVRNPRARRYVLRLRPDSSVRVTIPRGGSAAEARRFAERSVGWVERELTRLSSESNRPKAWFAGAEILLRGELVKLEVEVNGDHDLIRLANEVFRVTDSAGDLRPAIERYLWRLAAKELPPRVLEYAAMYQLPVRRITVRNQRSRWGSCSRHGTISLNWRLIQAPPFVRDYLILHELTHLREMNHSVRFWREVARVYPGYETAERWLRQHSSVLK